MDNALKKGSRAAGYAAAFGAMLVASCTQVSHVPLTKPMQINKDQEAQSVELSKAVSVSTKPDHLTSSEGPAPPVGKTFSEAGQGQAPPKLTGEPVTVKFEAIRLPAFINTVFGEILKVPYEIDDSLMKKDLMVTLSTGDKPLPREDFFRMVQEVLTNYGVGVVYTNNVYRVVESTSVKKPIPRIIRAKAGGSVPADVRPIFLFQPINSVPVQTMTVWLELVMKDRLQAIPLPYASGLLLLGNADDVEAATEIIQTLDQPYLAGSHSLKISPAFWSAPKLAQQLVDIMTAEGYSISTGGSTSAAIKLIPVDALNIIIAFGTGQEGLQHVLQWASQLDQPSQIVSSEGAFYYQVTNARAKDLADTIRGLVETAVTAPTPGAPQPLPTPGSPATATPNQGAANRAGATSSGFISGTKQKIMVDAARNGLIFVGTAEEYAQFLTLVKQMDRAPLQVLIECTIAEVDLKQDESLGTVLGYQSRPATAALNQTNVTSDSGGLLFSLVRDHGSITSQITALADTNRLQVISSPRLVTLSGQAAAINVGNQVPIITSQETAPSVEVSGTSALLQSVQYRSTGTTLNITPTINSARNVELNISQEVSDAQTNNLSGVQSPIIVDRSLQTTLSLQDGETALLGGMITENYSKGNQGIPYLKDIPILGNLFKTQSSSVSRTELIVLITPYIIDGPETARQLRDAFRGQLGDWADPGKDAAPNAKTNKP